MSDTPQDPNLLTPFKQLHGGSSSLRQISEDAFYVVNEVVLKRLGPVPIVKGDFHLLPPKVQRFIAEKTELMRPKGIYICDGSAHEAEEITARLIEGGMLSPLSAYENNYICRTDPNDVARVENKTYMVSDDKYDTECRVKEGVTPIMGHWMSKDCFGKELDARFVGCMNLRIMYVIPFSMGPIGSPLSKIGVQLTDSSYAVLSMRIMTRVSPTVFDVLGNNDFVRGIHFCGAVRPLKKAVKFSWPCDPENVFIAHVAHKKTPEIWSYGSGYGGNSLLGKKCFALRIASNIARDEGWLAEHMALIRITSPTGSQKTFAAAFPSACGKTNLAMLDSSIPGWKIRCIGDDIAWMKFNSEDGRLYAINPEAGFFGVAPGTSKKTNPMAVATFQKNSIFTNVAETDNGEYFWEGMEDDLKDKNVGMKNWLGHKWKIGDEEKAAHPNSRFCSPASQCPIIDDQWEDPKGVPIDGIIFGGRRPQGVPLVYETFDWNHGIFVASTLKSETTAAAEFKGKTVMHDPFAMRPFMGYNFGKYLEHWQSLNTGNHKVPKIFHVNWFRKGDDGQFLWPGFGDNIRVLDWMVKRLDGVEDIGKPSPIGILPAEGSINLEGLDNIKWDELMSVPKEYWAEDAKEVRSFLESQVGDDLPEFIKVEIAKQEQRIADM